MLKFKTKDKVIVITGKDKGKISIVKKIIDKKYAILENINISKKHTKGNPSQNKDGGIINVEMPVSLSNVMLINIQNNKKEKIKFIYKNKKKYRYFKSNEEILK